MQEEADQPKINQNQEITYFKYTFFKVVREWRNRPENEKIRSIEEFLSTLNGFSSLMELNYFSLVGLRADADFLIQARAKGLDIFQTFIHNLMKTDLGKYLEIPYSYLALTRKSPYLGSHKHPNQEGDTNTTKKYSKYIFVYPFIKKREWYSLPFVERQKMMAEHFAIGHKYPNITINTGYSFGIDDHEFVLAFEGDDPAEFLSLVEELRSSRASAYTLVETPIFTCRRVDPKQMLELIV
jgi:chlorite dismutase